MKKYDNKRNIVSNLIKKYRIKRGFSKMEVSRRLQLHAVYIDITELNRMEKGEMIVKDFELLALCKVLEIEYEDLMSIIE